MTKTCIIISGPTAVGKTGKAIHIAKRFSTQIISSDSRQCYKELGIAVAKPSVRELAEVKHHFIDELSIQNEFSAADFESYALAKANELFAHHDIIVMTGGTGLYIKAFAEGLDLIPPVDPSVRQFVTAQYEAHGLTWLQNEVVKNDPLFITRGDIENPRRLMRALEVKLGTGQSITTFQTDQRNIRDFQILQTGLELPRAQLYDRIDERVDKMLAAGLVAEARSLLPYRSLNALQTVGYRELFDYFDGQIELDVAADLIRQHTRQYAKRQMTWFKKDPSIHWFDAGQTNDAFTKSVEQLLDGKN